MVTPSEISVSLNDTVSVTCFAEGGPNNNFTWTTLATSGNVTFLQNDPELVINITEVDDSVYICRVENAAGYEQANLTVYSKFNIYIIVYIHLKIYLFIFSCSSCISCTIGCECHKNGAFPIRLLHYRVPHSISSVVSQQFAVRR